MAGEGDRRELISDSDQARFSTWTLGYSYFTLWAYQKHTSRSSNGQTRNSKESGVPSVTLLAPSRTLARTLNKKKRLFTPAKRVPANMVQLPPMPRCHINHTTLWRQEGEMGNPHSRSNLPPPQELKPVTFKGVRYLC